MKIIRYQDAEGVIGYAAAQDGRALRVSGDIYGQFSVTEGVADVRKTLAPVIPATIWCIGLNYRQHAIEARMNIPQVPVVFAKGPNAVQGPDGPVVIPKAAPAEIDYEGELVVVIGKSCKNVTRDRALDYVLGYTCGNDVSARDWQLKTGGSQWCRGKTFDTFAPIGPCLVTADEITDPNSLLLRTVVNGKTMQETNTSDMIFDVPTLIEFLSKSTTLLPGTIIFTGTPFGVGMGQNPPLWLKEGDVVQVEIERIGTLTNRFINEAKIV